MSKERLGCVGVAACIVAATAFIAGNLSCAVLVVIVFVAIAISGMGGNNKVSKPSSGITDKMVKDFWNK